MSGSKQTTLHQSFFGHGQRKGQQDAARNAAMPMPDLEEDEDAMLARALEESLRTPQPGHPPPEQPQPSTSTMPPAAPSVPAASIKAQWQGLFQQHGRTTMGPPPPVKVPPGKPAARRGRPPAASVPPPAPNVPHIITTRDVPEDQLPDPDQIEEIPGLDRHASRLWIYPTNYPVRSYQLHIVYRCLFENTLVVLPTGLGKTFIAAVVMYNYYRWYPRGKIVFMAPTKPLVAQQIEACYNIVGIPQADTAEMTGTMMPAERKRAWADRRVFFLTPQTMNNDLARGACPAESMKCLVVDEAHKALGNQAYCQVVRELVKHTEHFRVLALSATPGGDIRTVQQVISNLLVAHVEVRSDESPDIQQYQHERLVEKVVVPLGEEVSIIRTKYLRILEQLVNRLRRHGVMYGNRDVSSLGKFMILKAREAFRQNPPPTMQPYQFGIVEGDFALCMSLYHGYELLQQHGLRSMLTYLDSLQNGTKGSGRTKAELNNNIEFNEIMDMLHDKYKPVMSALPLSQVKSQTGGGEPFLYSHPKLKRLEEIILDHFQQTTGADGAGDGTETRVMIFSQLRDSVNEITEMLRRHRPVVRVMSFVGQSQGKVSKGFTQAEQLKVMRQFRSGGYNALVSTCVGEEGLDIGEVDLIVCYDAQKSPIRLIQRMGRTGRKRRGRIVMIMSEGKEEQMYNQSQTAKRNIYKHIQSGSKLVFYARSQRMVPDGLDPICHQMHITVTDKFQQNARNVEGRKASTKSTTSKSLTSGSKCAESSDDGLLTPEQLQYWSEHYKVVETPAVLAAPQIISLKKKEDKQPGVCSERTIDLSAWTPWQNRLQEYHKVDHSMQSRHLVELMEFMEVQAACGEDNDDYGQEMAMFLNKEDVSPEKNIPPANSILRYTESQETMRKKGTSETGNVNSKKKRVRRTIALEPIISDTEEKSDEDLPDFTEIMQKGAKVADPINLDPVEDNPDDCVDDDDNEPQRLMRNNDMAVISEGEITRKVLQRKKSLKKKKDKNRSNSGGNVSSIKPIIVDSDEGDFEGCDSEVNKDEVFIENDCDSRDVEVIGEVPVDFKSEMNDEPMEEDVSDGAAEVVGVMTEDTTMQEDRPANDADVLTKDNAVEEEEADEILQLLPTVTPLKFMQNLQVNPLDSPALPKAVTAVVKKAMKLDHPDSVQTLNEDGAKLPVMPKSQDVPDDLPDVPDDLPDVPDHLARPPLPPPETELDEALENLAERDSLSPLDLVSLVDEWQCERGREGCSRLDSDERIRGQGEGWSNSIGSSVSKPAQCTGLDSDEPMECDDLPPSLPFHVGCDIDSDSESSDKHWLSKKASVPCADIKIEAVGRHTSQKMNLVSDIHKTPAATMEPSLSDSQFVLAMEDDNSEDLFKAEDFASPSKDIPRSVTSPLDKHSKAESGREEENVPSSLEELENVDEPFKSYTESPNTKSVIKNPVKYDSFPKENVNEDKERTRSLSSSSTESVILAGAAVMSNNRALHHMTPMLNRQSSLRPSSTSTPLDLPRSRPSVPNKEQHKHVSFFEDDDDSLLAAVETPQTCGVSTAASRESSSSVSPQTPVNSAHHNSSVFTFTQAMACLDASNASIMTPHTPPHPQIQSAGDVAGQGQQKATSGSFNSSSSSRASVNAASPFLQLGRSAKGSSEDLPTASSISPGAAEDLPSSTNINGRATDARKDIDSISSPKVTDITAQRSNNSPSLPAAVAALSSDDLEEPQFELGFDLDEFDEEMVIGPSPPCASSQSLSQTRIGKLPLSAHASPACTKNIALPSSQKRSLSRQKSSKEISSSRTPPVSHMSSSRATTPLLTTSKTSHCPVPPVTTTVTHTSPMYTDTKDTPHPDQMRSGSRAEKDCDDEDEILSSQARQPQSIVAPALQAPTSHTNGDLSLGFEADQDLDDLDWTGLEQGLTCVPDSEAICVADSEILCVPDTEALCPPSPPPRIPLPSIVATIHSPTSLPPPLQPQPQPPQPEPRKKLSKLSSKRSPPNHQRISKSRSDVKPSVPSALPPMTTTNKFTEKLDNDVKKGRESFIKPQPSPARSEETSSHIDSPGEESDFKTPIKAPLRSRKQNQILISSDDDDSPLKPLLSRLKKSRPPPPPDTGTSEEEDFIAPLPVSKPAPAQPVSRPKKRKRKHKGGHEFLEVEAELSGENNSSDDSDHSDLDAMDASFINDGYSMSQQGNDSVDMQALYLKSMKDAAGPSRFKLNYDAQDMNVFSQVPQQDSEYMEDSFVVHSAQESEGEESSSSEEMLVTEQSMMHGVRTRRARRMANAAAMRVKPVKNKRRVVQMADSSSEDESHGHHLNQTSLSQAGRPRQILDQSRDTQLRKPSKARRLAVESSSSDNDNWDEFMTSLNSSGLAESPPAAAEKSSSTKTDAGRCAKVINDGSLHPSKKDRTSKMEQNKENCANVDNGKAVSSDNVISDRKQTVNGCLRTKMSSKLSSRTHHTFVNKPSNTLGKSAVDHNVCEDFSGLGVDAADFPESQPFTQIPSLASRLRSKMAPAAVESITGDKLSSSRSRSNVPASSRSNRPPSPPSRSNKPSSRSNRPPSPAGDGGMFDLDDGDLWSDNDDLVENTDDLAEGTNDLTGASEDTQYSESLLAPKNPSAPNKSTMGYLANNSLHKTIPNNISYNDHNTSVQSNTSHNINSVNNKTSPTGGKSAAELRAERLRLSRLKQEEFKRKYAQQKSPESARSVTMAASGSPLVTPAVCHVRPSVQNRTSSASPTTAPTVDVVPPKPSSMSAASATASYNAQGGPDKLLLLMDSREVNGAQDLVSCLRFDHKLEVAVRSLGVCDYQVSNRMGIKRKCYTDFICGTQRAKLMERLRALCDHFDRPCLIVEQERVKKDEKPRKPPARTKYLDKLVTSLAKTHIKVFYSSSQLSTASILQDLCHQESRKGQAISVPHQLTSAQEMVLGFYLSLPRVSYATALNLLHSCRTIADCINSSVSVLSRRGCMSEQRAVLVHGYLHHTFDAQMMPFKR